MATINQYMRETEIIFTGNSLCPDKVANMFFDEVCINAYCQRANELVVTSATDAAKFRVESGIVNTSTNAYARVLTISNNIVYLDQNYITLRVEPYGSNTFNTSSFSKDTILYQSVIGSISDTLEAVYPSTSNTYGTFLNRYGVWQKDQFATGALSREYVVDFPVSADGYEFFAAGDNGVTVAIDGVQIFAKNNNYANVAEYMTLTTTPGLHTIHWGGFNAGTRDTKNPGAVGLHIRTVDGTTTIFDSRDPPSTVGYTETVGFQGRVQYFNPSTKMLTVKPEKGSLNHTNNVRSSTLIIDNVFKANIMEVMYGTTFPASSVIRDVDNASNTATVISHSHYSGTYLDNGYYNLTNENLMTVNSNVSSSIVGSKITFTGGAFDKSGGVVRSITGVVSNTGIKMNAAITGMDSTTKYTIGNHVVDDYGVVSGIFTVPETSYENFKVGDKTFLITDANAASDATYKMRAVARFSAKTRNDATSSTLIPTFSANNPIVKNKTDGWDMSSHDPVAQTFYVPEAKNTTAGGQVQKNYGMFISSVDLFFSHKPDTTIGETQLPVTVRIVNVDNDVPGTSIYAQSVVQCKDIKISAIPSASNTATLTNFKFPDPVHLDSGKTYAITITTDSPSYGLHIAEIGGYVIGSTNNSKVSSQPYVGKFYKAQNASTWTPLINQDLMFRINKCVFKTNSVGTVHFNAKNQAQVAAMDAVTITGNEQNYNPTSTKYKIKANNVLGAETQYTYVTLNRIHSYSEDLATTNDATAMTSRRRIFTPNQQNAVNVAVELVTTDSSVTPVINKQKMGLAAKENIINNGQLSNQLISIASGGQHENVANIKIVVSEPTDNISGVQAWADCRLKGTISNADIIITSPGLHMNAKNVIVTISSPVTTSGAAISSGLKANAHVASLSTADATSGNISSIIVDYPGSGYLHVAPTITFSEPGAAANATGIIRCNVGAISFRGDVGAGYYESPTISFSELGARSNAVIKVAGETDASGGNCLAKYQTKRVDLAEDFEAGDLRVFLDCNRPAGTDILVYYKVKGAADPDTFDSKKWKLMKEVVKNGTKTFSKNTMQVIELEFRPNLDRNVLSYEENGITYPIGGSFKQYAIKVVFVSNDTTTVPFLTNLSAIASPSG